jgi:MFS family permease
MALYAPLSSLGDLWGVSFIKVAYGLDSEMAALVNNMLYLGVVLGAPFMAYIATLMCSYKKPMLIGIFCSLITMSLIVYCSAYINTAMLFVLFFLNGVGCSAILTYPLAFPLFPKSIGATVTGFINMMSMVSGIILMPLIGFLIKCVWNGQMQNGVAVYQLSDYVYGLTSVIAFSIFGSIIAFFVKDRSPYDVN